MLSAPATAGVKLTVVAKEEPPPMVVEHGVAAVTVAVALVLAPATKLTEGAGLPLQVLSFRIVVTGLSVAEGLTATPTADAGTVTLSTRS